MTTFQSFCGFLWFSSKTPVYEYMSLAVDMKYEGNQSRRHEVRNGSCITSVLQFMILFKCSSVALIFQILLLEFFVCWWETLKFPSHFQKPLSTVSNLSFKYMALHLVILTHMLSKKFIKKFELFNTSGLVLLFTTINLIICQLDCKQLHSFSQMVAKKIIVKN